MAQEHISEGGQESTFGRLNEDTHTVQVLDSAERLRSFAKTDLGSYEISREPSKPPVDMNEEEVADLVAFLLTLRGAQ